MYLQLRPHLNILDLLLLLLFVVVIALIAIALLTQNGQFLCCTTTAFIELYVSLLSWHFCSRRRGDTNQKSG